MNWTTPVSSAVEKKILAKYENPLIRLDAQISEDLIPAQERARIQTMVSPR
jgi:hypothetical protein